MNLLPDHLTDSILDAVASGWSTMEREGMSFQHPSRFILVGAMNLKDGELGPKILDHFGIYADTRNTEDPDLRFLVLRRNEESIADPSKFISKYRIEQEEFLSRVQAAGELLPEVEAS